MASPIHAEPSVLGDIGYEFHPAVAAWFEQQFPGGPTEAQAQGWPAIASGQDTLIAADKSREVLRAAEGDDGPILEELGFSSLFHSDSLEEMRRAIAELRNTHHGATDYRALETREIELPLRHWGELVNRAMPHR